MADADQDLVPAPRLRRHDEVILEPIVQVPRELEHLVQAHDDISGKTAARGHAQVDESRRLGVLSEQLDSLEVPAEQGYELGLRVFRTWNLFQGRLSSELPGL